VALRRTFIELSLKLDEFFRSLDSLSHAALDVKEERALGLANLVADGCDVVQGFLADAQASLAGALRALGPPLDLENARLAVVAAKDNYLEAVERLDDLREERLEQVEGEGAELGPKGPVWAATVRAAFEQGRSHAWEVVPAFFACFEEISERAVAGSVSVQTTSIGQQVNVGEESLAAADPGSLASAALAAGARAAVSVPVSRNPGGQP
jgi:hypothetical protein